ncbi:Predicted thiol-disulfide oxidoreductase YuxK, DCC family [Marivirga sericea]|uniref:Predicted thiol-disulfide oxidoreductase YuxK, DCC family n=1 Tax=Marivirga sericea TaxID=1028 RepID=A0A1X7KYB0_9BACT|nr:DCC1-like thiol-disulfide oxidoreductase family protein [Marivirga sericea]SMG46400.1 Predicted thiol-disulfide oxidoreductase YuxK, DCC family [Marivirga sericea]
MKEEKPIIFFDGVCNLCNGAINFIIDHDKTAYFKFAPLQSRVADEYLPTSLTKNTDSIILWESEKIYSRSTAALRIAKKLNGLWKLFYVFMIFPKFARDSVYKLIAKNRYKWFGKRETCRLPTEDIKNRFLEMD